LLQLSFLAIIGRVKVLEELLPLAKLDDFAATHADAYRRGEPFPHLVADRFFDDAVIDELIRSFPGPGDIDWLRYRHPTEHDKLQSQSILSIPSAIRSFIYAMNSSTFVGFLERLTGIEHLIPDPHLTGGGLHQTVPGGKLAIHADYNQHSRWRLDRRLNVIVYLNDGWKDEWGGALELWDAQMTRCVQRVFPHANRMVVFSTTDSSYHGHPDPLACPEDRTRKSIALYYYSNGRPRHERSGAHATLWRARPGEAFGVSLKAVVRDFVPPVLLRQLGRIGWRRG
jgi:hypothetical protein